MILIAAERLNLMKSNSIARTAMQEAVDSQLYSTGQLCRLMAQVLIFSCISGREALIGEFIENLVEDSELNEYYQPPTGQGYMEHWTERSRHCTRLARIKLPWIFRQMDTTCGVFYIKVIKRQLDIRDQHAVVNWSSSCLELLFDAYIRRSSVDLGKLGGPGIKVKIDESKFGKRKYHRGHHVEGQWIFGGFEEGTGRVFMVIVPVCGRGTLMQAIVQWIEPGTTIISNY